MSKLATELSNGSSTIDPKDVEDIYDFERNISKVKMSQFFSYHKFITSAE